MEIQRTFVTLHKEIAALSKRSEHVEIDTADHMSLITNKENVAKVVPYIVKVVKESANRENIFDSASAPKKKGETK